MKFSQFYYQKTPDIFISLEWQTEVVQRLYNRGTCNLKIYQIDNMTSPPLDVIKT